MWTVRAPRSPVRPRGLTYRAGSAPRLVESPLAFCFRVLCTFVLTVCFSAPSGALVGQSGLEPPTSRLSAECSNQLSYWPACSYVSLLQVRRFLFASPSGGDEGNRTPDPLLAGQVLSQLSYTPVSGNSP